MNREKLLLGFRPLHPAVRHFCQFCGVEVSKDDSIERSSRYELMSTERVHLFCQGCGPAVDRITNLLAGEEARLDEEHAAIRDAKLKEIVQHELDLLSKERLCDDGGSSAPPSDERTSPRSPRRRAPRQGMIPQPDA